MGQRPWTLWPFQGEGVERIVEAQKRFRRILVASPTGSGKTLVAMELLWRARERGMTAMFMAPRRELLRQTARKLDTWAFGEYNMIVSNSRGQNLYAPLQVASVDTLVSRVIKRQRLVLPPIHYVIVDEVHLYITALRTQLMEMFPDAIIIGLTATPGRHDGRAMNIGFELLLEIATPRQLIDQGFLMPSRHYAPSRPDLKNARIVAADYNKKDVETAMDPLVGGIVPSWLERCADRRTIVFASSVQKSVWLAEQFREAGVAAEHCDGTAEDTYRDAVFDRLSSGETQVLCNVDLATYGFDLPAVSAVVLACPSLSVVKYIQRLGRAARKDDASGKRDFVVNDHSGGVYEHGYFEDDRHWTLQGIKSVTRKSSAHARTGKVKDKVLHLVCKKCTFVFGGALTCPQCGYYFERTARKFHVVDGELVAIKGIEPDVGELEKRTFYSELLGHAQSKGYKTGWAAYAYQDRYKKLPPREWNRDRPKPPSAGTTRWLLSVTIRRAKARKKAQASGESQ